MVKLLDVIDKEMINAPDIKPVSYLQDERYQRERPQDSYNQSGARDL